MIVNVNLPASLSDEDVVLLIVAMQDCGQRLVAQATEQARGQRTSVHGRTADRTVRKTLAAGAMFTEVSEHLQAQLDSQRGKSAPDPVVTTVGGEAVVTADTLRAAAAAGQPAPVRAESGTWRATVSDHAELGDGQVSAAFADDLAGPSTERTRP